MMIFDMNFHSKGSSAAVITLVTMQVNFLFLLWFCVLWLLWLCVLWFLATTSVATTQFDKPGHEIVMELLDQILDDVVRNDKSVELIVCNDAILKYLTTMKKNSLLCIDTIKVLAGVSGQARPKIRFPSQDIRCNK